MKTQNILLSFSEAAKRKKEKGAESKSRREDGHIWYKSLHKRLGKETVYPRNMILYNCLFYLIPTPIL
jgi:hypothetical protein